MPTSADIISDCVSAVDLWLRALYEWNRKHEADTTTNRNRKVLEISQAVMEATDTIAELGKKILKLGARCPICREYEVEDLVTLPCGHKFHAECVRRWLQCGQNRDCPVCRHGLRHKCGHALDDALLVPGEVLCSGVLKLPCSRRVRVEFDSQYQSDSEVEAGSEEDGAEDETGAGGEAHFEDGANSEDGEDLMEGENNRNHGSYDDDEDDEDGNDGVGSEDGSNPTYYRYPSSPTAPTHVPGTEIHIAFRAPPPSNDWVLRSSQARPTSTATTPLSSQQLEEEPLNEKLRSAQLLQEPPTLSGLDPNSSNGRPRGVSIASSNPRRSEDESSPGKLGRAHPLHLDPQNTEEPPLPEHCRRLLRGLHSNALRARQRTGMSRAKAYRVCLEAILPASEDPKNQKQMLGEVLYPIVWCMLGRRPALAGKITGMLLGLCNAEILDLIESDQALWDTVQEAKSVYEEHIREGGVGHL
ncbi:uncharacterized protein BCR38DRAFT_410275 [Pseudomassariella vexata]|uniref:RING-type domain-containing protein n=1 Tax=Pseudomassariella vexata TaxID=1141098 RepID=A0A1Y2DVX7_9PEZI|nr:uncharacterized protein BCR38DRAFT_410275 [Pseudomassariella vexata]ORY63339.1 hypothetical protein BCR38DRAFT_410275 [Pseudomassariella vexata]